jgi:serine kinase of HPr protein (carbohydrate metabolism regulator)
VGAQNSARDRLRDRGDTHHIGGVKLPANASKARSGRRTDFQREAAKIERAVKKMLAEHQSQDADKTDAREVEKALRKFERMRGVADRQPTH